MEHYKAALIGKVFYFERLNPPSPELNILGQCRVTSLIIHEGKPPEIGIVPICQKDNSDKIKYYSLSELSFDGSSYVN